MDMAVMILTCPGTVSAWLDGALRSVDYGSVVLRNDQAGMCVGAARADGFRACADYRYTAILDSDDAVIPGALQACAEALDANPQAAFAWTRERLLCEPGFPVPQMPDHPPPSSRRDVLDHANHLCMFRTALVLPLLDQIAEFRVMPERILRGLLLRDHPAVFVDRIGYVWRQHPGQTSRRERGDAMRRERALLAGLRRELK